MDAKIKGMLMNLPLEMNERIKEQYSISSGDEHVDEGRGREIKEMRTNNK